MILSKPSTKRGIPRKLGLAMLRKTTSDITLISSLAVRTLSTLSLSFYHPVTLSA
ncbi:hypothetical protein CGCVW01_v013725 [Colletotrichum viniferum]|nr:hypothetical protein CGCVW01_v013725 [Colletotrichum viniferum]